MWKSICKWIYNKRLVIVILCICSIGSIFEIAKVSNIYFSYETVLNVELERPTMIELPSMTFCTSIYYTINYTQLIEKYPSFITDVETKMGKKITDFYDRELLDDNTFADLVLKYFDKLRVNERHEITIKVDDLVDECVLKTI